MSEQVDPIASTEATTAAMVAEIEANANQAHANAVANGSKVTLQPVHDKDTVANGFDAMGKPIPLYRKQVAYDTCKQMGVNNPGVAWSIVNGMSEQLERDKPYDAMNVGGAHLDLTGVYRIMAVLLTAPRPA